MYIQSRYSLVFLMGIKLAITLGFSIVTFSGILGISLLQGILTWKNLLFLGEALLLSIPSLIGMYGIGLIVGGLSLREKNIGQMVAILQTILLLVSNVFGDIKGSVFYLLPFPLAVELARTVYQAGTAPAVQWLAYLGVNFFWILLGTRFFHYMLEQERRKGSFDNY